MHRMTTIEAPPLDVVPPADAPEIDILLPQGSRILHIGPPKTGTTALQAAFHLGRDRTERQGVHYASHGRHAMTAVLAGIEQPSPWAVDRRPPSKWNWNRLVSDVRGSKARRVVLSSEFFADASPEAINRVVMEIGSEDIQIVVTLRPLARIMPSQWQQFVQNQLTIGFDDWLRGVLDGPRGKMTPSFWKRHRHDELVARWMDVVGPDRVTVVALDDNDRDMVLRVFERLTGLAVGTLVTEPDLSNRSMTVPEIEIVRAFNATFKADKLPAPLYSRVMRFGAAAYMRSRQPGSDEPRIELPAWSVEPIANLAREMMASIEATGVRIVGNLDLMTKVPVGREPTDESVAVTPHVAASAAMGVLVASGLARGTGAIEANESEGIEGDERPRRAPRPVQEPPELLRISTSQLAVVIFRRAKARLRDRLDGLLFWRRH
jgi:hypothetical protein